MTAPWPALPLEPWRPTYDTLHLWSQIVGKTRLALTGGAGTVLGLSTVQGIGHQSGGHVEV